MTVTVTDAARVNAAATSGNHCGELILTAAAFVVVTRACICTADVADAAAVGEGGGEVRARVRGQTCGKH